MLPYRASSIPDLNLVEASLAVLVDVDVDWEMCVDVTHLVLVALGDTDDHVVDESADGTEGSDTLAVAVVEFDGDEVLLWEGETDGQVTEVLNELACVLYEFSCSSSNLFSGICDSAYLVGPRR